MDKGTRSPRKGERNQRKQKKRKKFSSKKRPHKPEPGKFSTSPEISEPDGGSMSIEGQQNGIYRTTLTFDPRLHHDQIQKAPKPLSDSLERLSKPRQPKATSLTGPSSVRSEPNLVGNRRGYGGRSGGGGGGGVKQIHSDTRLDFLRDSANSSSVNESLRWEGVESDEEKEKERIRLYKINRRKRYIAAQNRNRDDWVAGGGGGGTGSGASIPPSPQLAFQDPNEFSRTPRSNESYSRTPRSNETNSRTPDMRSRSSSNPSRRNIPDSRAVSRHKQNADGLGVGVGMDLGGEGEDVERISAGVGELMVNGDMGSMLGHGLPKVAVV